LFQSLKGYSVLIIQLKKVARQILAQKNKLSIFCTEDFEFKSKNGKSSKKISAVAYSQMIKRINSSAKPNFFFMAYLADILGVDDFFVVPKHFIIPDIIEERKPLTETARRAGWIGSNILFSKIPQAG